MVSSLGISLCMGAGGLSKSASAESNVQECLSESYVPDNVPDPATNTSLPWFPAGLQNRSRQPSSAY